MTRTLAAPPPSAPGADLPRTRARTIASRSVRRNDRKGVAAGADCPGVGDHARLGVPAQPRLPARAQRRVEGTAVVAAPADRVGALTARQPPLAAGVRLGRSGLAPVCRGARSS